MTDTPPDDGLLRVYECVRVINEGLPTARLCGYVQPGPGTCVYGGCDGAALMEVVALVLCSDCHAPIMREDCRGNDGRLLCAGCVLGEIEPSQRRGPVR